MTYLTDAAIDVAALTRAVMRPGDGASVVFQGVVRDHHEGKGVESITYEAYRSMAEKEIDTVVQATRATFPDAAVAVQHRLGLLRVGETSIVIVCTSPHRS